MERINGGDVFDSIRVRATIFCRSTLGAPWGFAVRPQGNPSFHAVTHGGCWLQVAGDGGPQRLGVGDLVILPHGVEHALTDEPGSAVVWLDDLLEATPVDAHGRLRHGGDGAATELICGGFVLDPSPIIRSLPSVVLARGGWVDSTLDLVSEVTRSNAPGASAVLARVAETMLTQALRDAFAELGTPPDVFRDPQIAHAVQLVHERPEERWTLGELASKAAYSRSAFAFRFRDLVGEPPMAYVRRTRLARAASLLQQTDLALADIARRSGYATEASLSRAFKREFGVAPGSYRA